MFNRNVAKTAASPVSEAHGWPGADHPNVIDVSQAVPGYPPAADLVAYLAEVVGRPEVARYTPVLGLPELREELAADVSRTYQTPVGWERVAITAGCNQAFALAATVLAGPRDEVIVPLPYYFNHDMWLRIQDIRPVYVPGGDDLDPERVERAVTARTRAIVLVSPNNPTGTVSSPQQIQALAEVAARAGVRLVLDETYRDFRPTTAPPHGLFGWEEWPDTFVHLYSFSKVYSITGYRVGAIAAGADLLAEFEKAADCITICPPRVGQEAARYGLRHLRPFREEKRRLMTERVERFRRDLAAAASGFRLVSAGAYFAWVEHPFRGQTGREAARSLLDAQQVLALAGEMFGPGQEPYLRLAFANLDEGRIPELVERLAAAGP